MAETCKVDLAVLGMGQYVSWECTTTPSCVHVSYIAGGFSEPVPPDSEVGERGVPPECLGQLAQSLVTNTVVAYIQTAKERWRVAQDIIISLPCVLAQIQHRDLATLISHGQAVQYWTAHIGAHSLSRQGSLLSRCLTI